MGDIVEREAPGVERKKVDMAVDAGDPSTCSSKADVRAVTQPMTVWEGITYLTRLYFTGRGNMPVFILLAQDKLAYRTVIEWAEKAEKNGVKSQKVSGAWRTAEAMIVWARKDGATKLPD